MESRTRRYLTYARMVGSVTEHRTWTTGYALTCELLPKTTRR